MVEGRHELFGKLYDRCSTKVFYKCISFSKNPDDAKDMLHDVFLKTFANLSSFGERSSFSTWLYSITSNVTLNLVTLFSAFVISYGFASRGLMTNMLSAFYRKDKFKEGIGTRGGDIEGHRRNR